MNIGYNIYKYRLLNNLTQEELAFELDVSRQTIYKWENEISIPNSNKLLKICEVLNININNLFEK